MVTKDGSSHLGFISGIKTCQWHTSILEHRDSTACAALKFMSLPSTMKLYDGPWIGLSRGPHLPSYGTLVAINLLVILFFVTRALSGIRTAWLFFTRRRDLLEFSFEKSGKQIFSFNVLHVRLSTLHVRCPLYIFLSTQHNVTAIKGVSARKAFFDSKGLNFTEGYKILAGRVSPSLFGPLPFSPPPGIVHEGTKPTGHKHSQRGRRKRLHLHQTPAFPPPQRSFVRR